MRRKIALSLPIVLLGLIAAPAQAAPTRYEAESSPAVCQGTIDSNHAGYSGTGFCNATNAVGAYAEFTVNAANAGTATVGIRYANGTTADRTATVTGVSGSVSFPGTGAWTTWVTKTVTIPVAAGSNTIRLSPTTANGLANIDALDFEVAPPSSYVDYQAEECTIAQGIVEANHAGYTGSGFVNTDNVTGSYVECALSAAATSFSVRYANGTTVDRPMSVNGQTVSFPPTGAWSTWNEVTVNLASTTTIRLTSTTANGGPNLDRVRAGQSGPPDTTPPTIPGNPRVTGTTSSSISLAWDASTDNVGVTGYRVYEGSTVKATPSGTSATVSGLGPNTTHTFTVRAVDGAGNESGSSTSVTGTTQPGGSGTPVSINGQLHVCGTKLCNQYNKPIQLRGMSSHGLQWYGQCLNNASLDALASDWQADVLRISMYIQEGGYETDPRGFTDRVHGLIESATARGMYAIVDWHMLSPGDPNYNLARARTFFTEIANRHKSKVNIIYEVANEPSGVSWSTIRSYHNQIIPVIRAEDADGIVLLGTRAWSSLGISEGGSESEIINNPVNASNIMYTFHFYAASHGTEYINALSRAADAIPMFVTEFGTQTASGDGSNNFTRSQQYMDLMYSKKISWVNWNYSDDSRSGAVFTSGTCPGGPFAGTSRLKPAGVWIRDHIRVPADEFPTS